MNCIFCDIISKSQPSSVIFEDDLVIAIMDIFPIQNGHTLVLPKVHYPLITDCPDEVVARLALVMKKINSAVQKITNCDGILNELMNGEAAGQEIFHAHIHIIPRNKNDGFGWHYPSNYRSNVEDRDLLDQMALKISEQLNGKI